MKSSPSGPSAPWSDDEEQEHYAHGLAVEHARAVLLCRLEDRLITLKKTGPEGVLRELHKQMIELAAEDRPSEVLELISFGRDIQETR